MHTKKGQQKKSITLYADFAARQGKFARSTRTERTTSELIPLSTCNKIRANMSKSELIVFVEDINVLK